MDKENNNKTIYVSNNKNSNNEITRFKLLIDDI